MNQKEFRKLVTIWSNHDGKYFGPMKKVEVERKKWKKEWTDMPKAIGEDGELIPSWETFKRKKQRGK